MGLYRSLSGTIIVRVTCADVSDFLTYLSRCAIQVTGVQFVDDLTVELCIDRKDYRVFKQVAQCRAVSVKLLRRNGLYWRLKSLGKRPALLISMFLMTVLVMYVPTCVLFVKVEGNTRIPDKYILEQAQLCGIRFGASRRQVRSEMVKNNLLSAIPQLQWAGVNTYGCVAVVSVEERTEPEAFSSSKSVSSIVASRDGIIHSCVVTKGNALCKKGQAVKAGEVLVSGYTDLGIHIQATDAEGEIYAETKRNLTVLNPINYKYKGNIIGKFKKISLCFGKKRINFYKGSGISDASCDKMYAEHYLTLPGGFQLPVAILVEEVIQYDVTAVSVASETDAATAEEFALSYLNSQMISGKVTDRDVRVEHIDGACKLTGQYTCIEMIGRRKNEEIIEHYGEDN